MQTFIINFIIFIIVFFILVYGSNREIVSVLRDYGIANTERNRAVIHLLLDDKRIVDGQLVACTPEERNSILEHLQKQSNTNKEGQ